MAHDRQYKESVSVTCHGLNLRVDRFDCPKEGELFWNRNTHQVEEADRDLQEKFLIVKGEN